MANTKAKLFVSSILKAWEVEGDIVFSVGEPREVGKVKFYDLLFKGENLNNVIFKNEKFCRSISKFRDGTTTKISLQKISNRDGEESELYKLIDIIDCWLSTINVKIEVKGRVKNQTVKSMCETLFYPEEEASSSNVREIENFENPITRIKIRFEDDTEKANLKTPVFVKELGENRYSRTHEFNKINIDDLFRGVKSCNGTVSFSLCHSTFGLTCPTEIRSLFLNDRVTTETFFETLAEEFESSPGISTDSIISHFEDN